MLWNLDPRAKLYLILLANLMLFFHVDQITEMIVVGLFLIPMYGVGRRRTALRFLIIYLVMLAMDLWLIPVAEGFFLNFISLLSVGIRMMLPCVIAGTFAFTTTTVGEFVCAMRKLHIPESVIIPCVVVIRYFPTVREDYQEIRNAMSLRGIGGIGLIRHPARTLEYILIPLLMNSSNVAQDLSVAALTKGISMAGKHTCMYELRVTWLDWSWVILCTLPIVGFIGGTLSWNI